MQIELVPVIVKERNRKISAEWTVEIPNDIIYDEPSEEFIEELQTFLIEEINKTKSKE